MGFDTREERKAYKLGIEKAEGRLMPRIRQLEAELARVDHTEDGGRYALMTTEGTEMAHTVEEYAGEQIPPFMVGDSVIYEGKSYSFPGEVVSIDGDGAYTVKAFGHGGYYGGMKHIYGPGVLKPFDREKLMADYTSALQREIVRANKFEQSASELTDAINRLNGRLSQVIQEREDMRDALHRTREDLVTRTEHLSAARSERDDAVKRALDRESTINTLKNEYEYIAKVANDRFNRIEGQAAAIDELTNKLKTVDAALSARNVELGDVTRERDELKRKIDNAVSTLRTPPWAEPKR